MRKTGECGDHGDQVYHEATVVSFIFGTLYTLSLPAFMTLTTAPLVSECTCSMLGVNGQKEGSGFIVSSQ